MTNGPIPLRELLAGVGGRLGLDAAVETGRLFAHWRRVVGREVADHAQPTSLREGVLRIRADSPIWANEISYLAEEIRARANEALGRPLIRQVQVWTGPAPKGQSAARSTARAARTPVARDAARHPPATDPESALDRARRAWARRRSER